MMRRDCLVRLASADPLGRLLAMETRTAFRVMAERAEVIGKISRFRTHSRSHGRARPSWFSNALDAVWNKLVRTAAALREN